jgi:type VI secretion system protein ImpF
MRERDISITPSVLDRLIDLDPRSPTEAPRSGLSSIAELKQAVRRDLEWLLNSRRQLAEIDERLEEVPRSVALYGLPDFTGLGAKNVNDHDHMVKTIEGVIEIFEPRFRDVEVTLEPVSNVDRQLTFRITANLDIEPTPEPVVFDTQLQFGSGEITVKEA